MCGWRRRGIRGGAGGKERERDRGVGEVEGDRRKEILLTVEINENHKRSK